MANKKIKGITIKFGADTMALSKALKSAEDTSKSLGSELSSVNKLLKFDPKNTQLLAQKQELLSKQVENTKEKLEALKQAQGEVEKKFKSGDIGAEEYREFQREIAKTEQDLKSYTTQISRMETEQKSLKESTKQLQTLFEATGKSLDDFQDILGTRLTNAIKNGTANSDDLTVALNKIGKEAFGAETDLSKMKATLNKVDDGASIDEVNNDLNEMKKNSGEAGEALDGIGKGIVAGNMMQAAEIIADAGQKIKEFSDNAKEAFNEVDAGSDAIITATGATGKLAEGMDNVYKSIASSLPIDNLENIGKVIGEMNTQFGFTDEKLQHASEKMLKFSEITGSDVVASTQNAKQAISVFHMSSDDLDSVLDDVAKTAQDTGVSVDDLFQKAIEGAPQLQELGLSFSDSVKLLGAFEQAGVDGSAALSSLSKAAVNYAKDGKSLTDGLAETQDKILNATDQTEALNAAAEVFGTKGAVRMVDAIQRGVLNLNDLGGAASDSQGTVETTFSNTLDPIDEETVALNNVKLAMAEFGSAISEAVAPILEALVPIIQKVAKWFSSLSGTSKTIIVVISGIAMVISALLPILAVVAGGIAAAGGAMAFLTGVLLPVAGIIAGIIAVVAAVVAVIKNWGDITDWLSKKWNAFKDWMSGLWDSISEKIQGVWNGIKGTLGGIWDSIKEKAMDAFSSVWKFIKDGFNNLKDTLGGIVKGIANAIVKPIGGAVNGVINGVNWVLDKVGSDKQFALWEVPKFARGTGGIPKDTLGIVNDQKGSTYKEMIVPPHGKPFIPEGRDVVLPLEKGTKIMPANQTKSFLEELPHFASGIGDFFGGIWSTVKDFTGNVWDYITHPSKIVQIAIDKFTDLTGAFEPWISVAKGAVNTVFDSVVGFVKGIFDTQSHVNYNPSAGVEQWRTLATRALQMTGQYSEANLERLLYQMQTESGGNPNAINNWDINAINGTPSKGLMQVIDPTFRAYAMPGYDKNIYDPLSNMLASIRYAVSTYGSLAAAYRGVGYEDGIGDINLSDLLPSLPMLDVKWFKDGGILTKPALFQMPSGGIGGAAEREAEAITPLRSLKGYIKESILEIMGEKDINLNINLTTTLDGRVVAQQTVGYARPMIKKMDDFEKLLGGERVGLA